MPLIRLVNHARPPRPVTVDGPRKISNVRQILVRKTRRGLGVKARNHGVPENITILPGSYVDVDESWRNAPDVVRQVKLKMIRIADVPDPARLAVPTPAPAIVPAAVPRPIDAASPPEMGDAMGGASADADQPDAGEPARRRRR